MKLSFHYVCLLDDVRLLEYSPSCCKAGAITGFIFESKVVEYKNWKKINTENSLLTEDSYKNLTLWVSLIIGFCNDARSTKDQKE